MSAPEAIADEDNQEEEEPVVQAPALDNAAGIEDDAPVAEAAAADSDTNADADDDIEIDGNLQPADLQGVNFPSSYLCPYLHDEPPVDGVYFDIRGSNGELSQQIFEYSRLYRHISTLGTGRAFRSVRHPINGGWISRETAMNYVRRVSAETQMVLNAERAHRDLDLVDDEPLNERDFSIYEQSIARVANP